MTSPQLDAPIRTMLEAALDCCFRNAGGRRDVLRFLDAVRIPVIVTDASTGPSGPQILHANAEMCELCGHPRAQLVGRSPRLLQGPETDLAQARAFRAALETHGRATVRLINYRADGRTYPVLIRAGRLDLGTRLDDQLRIAFETELSADMA
jgi:PAS domain S-box-containing protein